MNRKPCPVKHCKECQQPIPRTKNEGPQKYGKRAYCGKSCATRATKRGKSTRTIPDTNHSRHIISEVEWLLGTDTIDSIAHRLGYRYLNSLQRALERWGRTDLAAHFQREETAA